ncbi:DNA alkylation repair protein [Ascidiaceihabitans sp.]|uniref:DNA alkylation repair protein n=1 Tax=Ascidiaceihabitans sp. TaxID=1872644 RepID=UPI003298760E
MADALFNPDSVGQLAAEFAAGVPGFDAARFARDALAGFESRALMARMEWLADCAQAQLSPEFAVMADQLEAAMPAPLDPDLTDDDFGHFIHAVPGILAVRHGLQDAPDRALDLLLAATQRFSMEFYIRDFINHWPEKTQARLIDWAQHDNYHVRRLVSEGTRPKLPWAKAITMSTQARQPLLDALQGDKTRYVTRSVANHLNDLSKSEPDTVLQWLGAWQAGGQQDPKELGWMTKHALRTLIKQGHEGAMGHLGYHADAPIAVRATLQDTHVAMGQAVTFQVEIEASQTVPLLIDYRIRFARPGGKISEKVFKLKQTEVHGGKPCVVKKAHKLKGGASTFTLHPGAHQIIVQVNGRDHATLDFDLTQT